MENKLIPLTEFVNRIDELVPRETAQMYDLWKQHQLMAIQKYCAFLSQPLKLEYFVPCDNKGNILEDPGLMPSQQLNDYREAKEKVLFEGFVYIAPWYGNHIVAKDKLGSCQITFNSQYDVEKILYEACSDIILSPTALKQIYG